MRTIEGTLWIAPTIHNVTAGAWVTFLGVTRNGLLNEVLLLVLRFSLPTDCFLSRTAKENVEADHRSVFVGNVSRKGGGAVTALLGCLSPIREF